MLRCIYCHSRFAYYEDGSCLIGMKRVAMIPLIAFDILVNVGCMHFIQNPTPSNISRSTLPPYFSFRSAVGSTILSALFILTKSSYVLLQDESQFPNSHCRPQNFHWELLDTDFKRRVSTLPTTNYHSRLLSNGNTIGILHSSWSSMANQVGSA